MRRRLAGCILAGGYGSRVKHLVGDYLPKAMLPTGGRQLLIDVAVQKMLDTVADSIIVACGYRSALLIDHVSNVFPERRIVFWVDREICGPTNALVRVHQTFFRDDEVDVVVIPSDQVYDFGLQPAIDSHRKTRAYVTEITVLPNVAHCKKVTASDGMCVSVIGHRIVGGEFLRWVEESPERVSLGLLDLVFDFSEVTETPPNIFTYEHCLWEDLGDEERYRNFRESVGDPT